MSRRSHCATSCGSPFAFSFQSVPLWRGFVLDLSSARLRAFLAAVASRSATPRWSRMPLWDLVRTSRLLREADAELAAPFCGAAASMKGLSRLCASVFLTLSSTTSNQFMRRSRNSRSNISTLLGIGAFLMLLSQSMKRNPASLCEWPLHRKFAYVGFKIASKVTSSPIVMPTLHTSSEGATVMCVSWSSIRNRAHSGAQ
mmetsp:Transcript_126465/g.339269  ORF Transcript_126465/g.339269 Transcript_126465/m.339269 type:complete len:200 (-) Transcript_126465:405-1004(-)